MDTRVIIIAAVAGNGAIGRDGDIPWRLQDDLQRFRELTEGHTVIVGRKTHGSIVRQLGRPLPNRRTIVLTRNLVYAAPGCRVVNSWEEAMNWSAGEEEIFVIGGAEIYRLALPRAEWLYLTRVNASVAGDAYMPPIDWRQWYCLSTDHFPKSDRNEYSYSYEVWTRRR